MRAAVSTERVSARIDPRTTGEVPRLRPPPPATVDAAAGPAIDTAKVAIVRNNKRGSTRCGHDN